MPEVCGALNDVPWQVHHPGTQATSKVKGWADPAFESPSAVQWIHSLV